MAEPIINQTVRAYVMKRLREGEIPATVRNTAISAFVEPFAEGTPDQSFVEPYRKQITKAVDATIKAFAEGRTELKPGA